MRESLRSKRIGRHYPVFPVGKPGFSAVREYGVLAYLLV